LEGNPALDPERLSWWVRERHTGRPRAPGLYCASNGLFRPRLWISLSRLAAEKPRRMAQRDSYEEHGA
jgi:hypothetical protein